MVVTVTPSTNFTVPVTYRENISYDCMVAPGARPEWTVNSTFQFIDRDDTVTSQIADNNIFIEIISPVITRLVITPEARDARLQDESMNTIECKCRGVFELDGEEITTVAVFVTIYSELCVAHISVHYSVCTYVRQYVTHCRVTVYSLSPPHNNLESCFTFQIALRPQAT